MQNNNRLIQAILRNNFSIFVAKSFYTVSPNTLYLPNWHIDFISKKLIQIQNGEITRLIINTNHH